MIERRLMREGRGGGYHIRKKKTLFSCFSLSCLYRIRNIISLLYISYVCRSSCERFEKRRTCCLRNCEIRSFDHNASPTPLLSPTISSNRSQSNQKSLSKSLNSSSNLNTPRRILINLNWKLSRNSSNSFKRDYRLLS